LINVEPCTNVDFALYEQNTGYIVDPGQFRGIKAVKDGAILGIIGLDYWTPTAVQMHVWIKTPVALRGGKFLTEAFS
jgi:hypothetical protein